MAADGLSPFKKYYFAFMTCVLKVNTCSSTWQTTLIKVLNNVNGVTKFGMNEDGKVEISGTIDPNQLLKVLAKAGKRAELCYFQFGECSSNLYMPTTTPQTPNNYYYNHAQNGNYDSSYYGCGDDRYLQYDGYGPKRPFPHLYLPSPPGSATNGNALQCETHPNASATTTSRTPTSGTTTRTPMSGKGTNCCSLM